MTAYTTGYPDSLSSPVIHGWLVPIQDAMPDTMRNSVQWKAALLDVPRTGREPDDERFRLDVIMDWMWAGVLPLMQPLANSVSYGWDWQRMCDWRSVDVARKIALWDAAKSCTGSLIETAVNAFYAAEFAQEAWTATGEDWTHRTSWAARHAAYTAIGVGDFSEVAWERIDPPALLERLVQA